jgi:hypothetical protein
VTLRPSPVLEPRPVETFVQDLRTFLPAFVPGWRPGPAGPGAALMQVYGRFLKTLADRVNAAPDKNKLAFFDRLGIELVPAQAARAPIVFRPLPIVKDSRVPARTRVGAKIEGQSDPVIFETEQAIALAEAKLCQVVSLWPGRDQYADHTKEVLSGAGTQLFSALLPVAHVLYLSHDTLFALAGKSTVEVRFDLAAPGAVALAMVWEYWDGKIWRPFREFLPIASAGGTDPIDGSAGLTHGGVVRLVTECGSSARTTVDAIEARWIRARLTTPLPPVADARLPQIERIMLNSLVDRTLSSSDWLQGRGILPDPAFADEQKLDLTKTVQPLGARPQAGSALYLACEEIMTKPGAEVTLRYQRVTTPEEQADTQAAGLEADVTAAKKIVVNAAIAAVNALLNETDGLVYLANNLTPPEAMQIAQAALALRQARDNMAPDHIDRIAAADQAAADLRALLPGIGTGVAYPPTNPWGVGLALLAGLLPGLLVDSVDKFITLNETRIDNSAASLKLSTQNARDVLDQLEDLTPLSAAMAAGGSMPSMTAPVVAWEYWNGKRWTALDTVAPSTAPQALVFGEANAEIRFTVPDDAEIVEHAGTKARWIRARLTAGGFGLIRTVSWKDQDGKINYFPIVEIRPPHIERLRVGYLFRSRPAPPERCLTYNDFRTVDLTEAAFTRGTPFEPFTAVADLTPSLYMGFDKPLPVDLVSLYLDIGEVIGEDRGPELVWEGWDGENWVPVRERDETRGLALPGMLEVPWPGSATGADPVLARFGTALTWLRARLATDGPPRKSAIKGLYLNAAWAAAIRSYDNETLGSSTGQPEQTFFTRNLPVLDGECLEVRELSGARARVEEPILREELLRNGVADSDVRVVKDSRSGQTSEVWVRWRRCGNLGLASPLARVYELERTRGRFRFGGKTGGLTLPAGIDNVRLAYYRAGGGSTGNVARGAINQLLAGVLAEGVSNPRSAEGGADGEDAGAVLDRGGATIRNRLQPIAANDYEALAREASPGVALARARGCTHPSGRSAPGWVTVLLVPQSADSRPVASYDLREKVRRFLASRAPAAIAGQIAVIPATYFPVGVNATIRPLLVSEAGVAVAAAKQALARFLHPLTGGPSGAGWPFGRDVFLSDVSSLLEALPGLDYVEELNLTVGGSPVGERVVVPEDRVVVAGPLNVRLAGGSD